jgi:HD superfamily phosphohydrolase YqeK
MLKEKDFEDLITKLTDRNTLTRADSVSDNVIRILKTDKENGLIEAEVQGNTIVPYKLTIDISKKNFNDVITHDCPDFLARKKLNNKFCKHIVKFFLVLKNQDFEFANTLLSEFNSKVYEQTPANRIDLQDMNHFINKNLKNQLDFDYKGFDYFFEVAGLEDAAVDCIKEILMETKRLPAALRGFHGGYEGGLFDHILLVTNYTYILGESGDYDVDIKKAILTAIYHDFGKISYYSYKMQDISPKITVEREELDLINQEIIRRFNYEGRDYHVEEALAILKKYRSVLFFDDDMYKAIIFHHGQWSRYYPIEMNDLATLVHNADMIASQTHFV